MASQWPVTSVGKWPVTWSILSNQIAKTPNRLIARVLIIGGTLGVGKSISTDLVKEDFKVIADNDAILNEAYQNDVPDDQLLKVLNLLKCDNNAVEHVLDQAKVGQGHNDIQTFRIMNSSKRIMSRVMDSMCVRSDYLMVVQLVQLTLVQGNCHLSFSRPMLFSFTYAPLSEVLAS